MCFVVKSNSMVWLCGESTVQRRPFKMFLCLTDRFQNRHLGRAALQNAKIIIKNQQSLFNIELPCTLNVTHRETDSSDN